MIPLLFLAVAGALAWRFLAAGEPFLPGFARLLDQSTIQSNAFSFFSGRSYASGRFQGREVALRLQLKRSRYGQGYLVVAMRTEGPAALDYDGIDARTRDDGGRRALVALAANDLRVSVEGGWLKALWQPQGFIIFPGRFSEEKWRQVLTAMHAVAGSLDAAR